MRVLIKYLVFLLNFAHCKKSTNREGLDLLTLNWVKKSLNTTEIITLVCYDSCEYFEDLICWKITSVSALPD